MLGMVILLGYRRLSVCVLCCQSSRGKGVRHPVESQVPYQGRCRRDCERISTSVWASCSTSWLVGSHCQESSFSRTKVAAKGTSRPHEDWHRPSTNKSFYRSFQRIVGSNTDKVGDIAYDQSHNASKIENFLEFSSEQLEREKRKMPSSKTVSDAPRLNIFLFSKGFNPCLSPVLQSVPKVSIQYY